MGVLRSFLILNIWGIAVIFGSIMGSMFKVFLIFFFVGIVVKLVGNFISFVRGMFGIFFMF